MFPKIRNLVLTIWLFVMVYNLPSIAIDTDPIDNSGKEPEDISVRMADSTTIILSWKFLHNFMDDLRSLIVWYRPRDPIDINLPRLEYSNVTQRYKAFYGAKEKENQWKNVRYPEFYREPEISEENEMLIYTTNLLANTEYDFVIHRIPSNVRNLQTARIIAETSLAAPESGAGCFRVVDARFATRTVHFYWTGFAQEGDYDIEIREEGSSLTSLVFKARGKLTRGFKEVTISNKRHWFSIRRYEHPEAGASVVNIPHQKEVFEGPRNLRLVYEAQKNLYSLTWNKPDKVRVTNYTIFWKGIRSNRRTIMKIMHIPGDRTSFEVTSMEHISLFLAANSDWASSGLHMPESHPED